MCVISGHLQHVTRAIRRGEVYLKWPIITAQEGFPQRTEGLPGRPNVIEVIPK
jgi:hypothetical protein